MASSIENEPPLEDGYLGVKTPKPSTLSGGAEAEPDGEQDDDDILTDKEWIEMFRRSLRASSDYQNQKLKPNWSRNYRAFNNKHISGSKYDSFRYRHRSKLFKPKTRMAVRKNDATAASALFSTVDVVSVTPERSSDRVQQLTARFLGSALNYRLNRSTRMTGPNWFMTAIGARQDTQLTGVCFSKQHWEFEEEDREILTQTALVDDNGTQLLHPETNEQQFEHSVDTEKHVVTDRLMITLLPGEHCFTDPTADWRDPIQSGGYFFAAYPIRLDDVENMIAEQAKRPKLGGGAWRTDIDIKSLTQARTAESQRNEQVRRAREDGQDRYESRFSDSKQKDIIWLYDCYYRYNGRDWNWWMLGENIVLSDVRPTRDAYPEQKGDRPYTMGVGALEAHKPYPMAPVESWLPLQQELNDVTNLTLDAQKMAISPITKIKRGRNIDFKQVQNRGPDAMVMVEDEDDVVFEKAPGPDGSQQLQINNLNVDFDELSGTFSQGSVQTNRQMNETVGGMNLMSQSANALTEFDLRVWVETWVEPTLRQCVRLIQHYESSETVIAVAGENAGLIVLPGSPAPQQSPLEQTPDMQQGAPGGMPGMMPGQPPQQPQQGAEPPEQPLPIAEVLAHLDDAVVSVRVDVGIGALDSRQKLEKFAMGMKMTMESLPILQASGIMPNGGELMTEQWGLLGYKDADRFFKKAPPAGPPPEVQQMMLEMKLAQQKAADEAKARQQEMQIKQAEFQLEMRKSMMDMQMQRQQMAMDQQKSEQEIAAKQQVAQIDATTKVRSANLDLQARSAQHDQAQQEAADQHALAMRTGSDSHAQTLKQGDEAFRAKQTQGEAAFKAKQEQTAAAAKQQQKLAAAKPKAKPQGKERK